MDEKIEGAMQEFVEVRGVDECWAWTGRRNAGGYGQISVGKGADRTTVLAHRVAYLLDRRAQPASGMLVIHSCDNPPCCNPRHLREGTAKDNAHDMMSRGRNRLIASGGPMKGVKGPDHPASKYDAATREEALRLHVEEGWSRSAIADLLGCARFTVTRWLGDAKRGAQRERVVNVRPRGIWHPRALYSEEQRVRAIEAHRRGWSNSRIAKYLGCDRHSVARWLQEATEGARTAFPP